MLTEPRGRAAAVSKHAGAVEKCSGKIEAM